MHKPRFDSPIPAVAYLGRSSDGESQEHSIPDQQSAVQRYASEKGYTLIRWYVDDGISGDATEKRLEFQRMLHDAQHLRDFKAIVCWDQSRFGRFSPQEAGYWTYPLLKAGIRLVTVDKGPIDWNDFTGWLTYSVDQHAKHQFLTQLSRDVTRGQSEAARNGGWLGTPPYAYRIERKRKQKRLLIDDPAKVRIVQRIFREFVEDGRSLMNIAARLNEDGTVSPSGKIPRQDCYGKWVDGWSYQTVTITLENPAYTGDYAAGRTYHGKYHTIGKDGPTKGGKRSKRPQAEWIIRRDWHEAIIDHATFEKAQAILAKGRTGRSHCSPETNPYIFGGLLRCGRCGATLRGTGQGRGYRYYQCSNNRHNGRQACVGTTVREDVILRSIADCLDWEFFKELDGRRLAERAQQGELKATDLPKAYAHIKALLAPPRQPTSDRKRMARQVKELTEQIHKAQRNLALVEPQHIPSIQQQIEDWQTERNQLDLELAKKPPTEPDLNTEALEVLRALYWLSTFFRMAAVDPNKPPETEAGEWLLLGDFRPHLKPYLRKLAGITVHTQLQGTSRRTRHIFASGEIALMPRLDAPNRSESKATCGRNVGPSGVAPNLATREG
jgi:DNA invertase Pin-like site-specific DNA recombinase